MTPPSWSSDLNEVFGEYDPDRPCPRCFMPADNPYDDERPDDDEFDRDRAADDVRSY